MRCMIRIKTAPLGLVKPDAVSAFFTSFTTLLAAGGCHWVARALERFWFPKGLELAPLYASAQRVKVRPEPRLYSESLKASG